MVGRSLVKKWVVTFPRRSRRQVGTLSSPRASTAVEKARCPGGPRRPRRECSRPPVGMMSTSPATAVVPPVAPASSPTASPLRVARSSSPLSARAAGVA